MEEVCVTPLSLNATITRYSRAEARAGVLPNHFQQEQTEGEQ